jgi:hypothetical protein
MVFMQRTSEMKLLLSTGLFAAAATSAFADAILVTPNEVIIGIHDAGHLNIPYRTATSLPQLTETDPAGVGFIGLRTWNALLTGVEQGCQCEGWGVAARFSARDFLDASSVNGFNGLDQVEVESTVNRVIFKRRFLRLFTASQSDSQVHAVVCFKEHDQGGRHN